MESIKDYRNKELIAYIIANVMFLIFLSNSISINDVLKYKGCNVYVNRDDLKLASGEYLDDDFIGLNVIIDGKIVGNIVGIRNQYKQPLFVVKTLKGDCLIPYVSDIIEDINLIDGYVKIKDIKGLV